MDQESDYLTPTPIAFLMAGLGQAVCFFAWGRVVTSWPRHSQQDVLDHRIGGSETDEDAMSNSSYSPT
jgi:hypothetical protein